MGYKLPSIAIYIYIYIYIYNNNLSYKLQDKGQLLVIISRIKYAKYTIFVGNKETTLYSLSNLLKIRTQWTDYMEILLSIVTINNNDTNLYE